MISSSDILHSKVLIVDDQRANVLLLEPDAARRRLCFHHVHDGSRRGLPASPQEPLRFDHEAWTNWELRLGLENYSFLTPFVEIKKAIFTRFPR
jgi:hypothetical protein